MMRETRNLAHLFDPKNVGKLHDPERMSFQNPERLFPLIRNYKHGDCAEIGCGSGYFTFPMANHLAGRGTCYAIDLQQEMLALLDGAIHEKAPDAQIRTMLCTAGHLDLPDQSLELLWMVNVFHELSDSRAMIGEVLRTLASSGQCFVIDWKKEDTPKGPPVSERVSEVILYDHLIEAGFSRIRSHDLYPWHYVVEALRD